MSDTQFLNYALYTINIDYVQYLHDIDPEVFFDSTRPYKRKPYLGILVNLGTYKYFIPFTSAKKKHEKWELNTYDHMLVVEKISKKKLKADAFYKDIDKDPYNVNQIHAVLMFSKMIPVKDGLYNPIDISAQTDLVYKDLLMKEYSFSLMHQKEILQRATKAYNDEIKDGKKSKAYDFFVDYKKDEDAADKYPLK